MKFDQTDLEFCDGPLDGVRLREFPVRADKILILTDDDRIVRYEVDRSRVEKPGPRLPGLIPEEDVDSIEVCEVRETWLPADFDEEIREAMEGGLPL